MPHKTWLAGEKVNAAQFNPYVQDQVVAQFPDAATRDAQWSAPPTGACCVLTTAPNVLLMWNGSAWIAATLTRYGAEVTSQLSLPNNAVTAVSNFVAASGSPAGGAAVSGSGITMPAVPGLVAVSVRLESAVAPTSAQRFAATLFSNAGTAYAQTQVFIGAGNTIASVGLVVPVDLGGSAWTVQLYQNTGAAVVTNTRLDVWRVGA
jgi:hypothetical protein